MPDKRKAFFTVHISEFILAILLVISGVMFSARTGGFVINFKQIGFSIFSVAEKGISGFTGSVTRVFTSITELAKLREEYAVLVEKLKDYEYMQRTNSDIRKENARLKEQLGFSESLVEKNFPANIISRGGDNLYSTIIINKGSVHGIKKNLPVIAIQHGNVGIVGKVVMVSAYTSEVMPLYDLNCTISSRIQNTRDIGLVTGNGNEIQPLSMKYIKKRVIDELHFGDVVVTSGENGNYLRDIPIGTISKITVLDYDTSLDIEIKPIIDFSRLETVVVVDQRERNENFTGEPK